jgi:hypothetical protein
VFWIRILVRFLQVRKYGLTREKRDIRARRTIMTVYFLRPLRSIFDIFSLTAKARWFIIVLKAVYY